MQTRPMWTAVDGAHHKKNVLIIRVVMIPMIVLAVFVQQALFVKVIIIICNVKNLSLSIVVPTCIDGVKNGNESDVDCGGSCLPSKQCANGLRCNSGSDCISAVCTSNICQGKYSYL